MLNSEFEQHKKHQTQVKTKNHLKSLVAHLYPAKHETMALNRVAAGRDGTVRRVAGEQRGRCGQVRSLQLEIIESFRERFFFFSTVK